MVVVGAWIEKTTCSTQQTPHSARYPEADCQHVNSSNTIKYSLEPGILFPHNFLYVLSFSLSEGNAPLKGKWLE